MGILSAAKANAVKRKIERALPDTCAVVRVTRTIDSSSGGYTDAEATYASGIPCRVDKSGLTSRERAVAERLEAVSMFNLMLSVHPARWPGGAPSTLASDRFVVTGDGAGTYTPSEDGGPATDELVRTIVCRKVE